MMFRIFTNAGICMCMQVFAWRVYVSMWVYVCVWEGVYVCAYVSVFIMIAHVESCRWTPVYLCLCVWVLLVYLCTTVLACMRIFEYMYACVCLFNPTKYDNTYSPTYTFLFVTCTHVYEYVCVYTRVRVYVHMYACTSMRVHKQLCVVCARMYAYIVRVYIACERIQ